MEKYKYVQANIGFSVVYPMRNEAGYTVDIGRWPVVAWAIDPSCTAYPVTMDGLIRFQARVLELPDGTYHQADGEDFVNKSELLDYWNKGTQEVRSEDLEGEGC